MADLKRDPLATPLPYTWQERGKPFIVESNEGERFEVEIVSSWERVFQQGGQASAAYVTERHAETAQGAILRRIDEDNYDLLRRASVTRLHRTK